MHNLFKVKHLIISLKVEYANKNVWENLRLCHKCLAIRKLICFKKVFLQEK